MQGVACSRAARCLPGAADGASGTALGPLDATGLATGVAMTRPDVLGGGGGGGRQGHGDIVEVVGAEKVEKIGHIEEYTGGGAFLETICTRRVECQRGCLSA